MKLPFIIIGSKWITNKWIRWYHQALTFPCDTSYTPGIDKGIGKYARLKPLSNDLESFLPNGRANLQPLKKKLALYTPGLTKSEEEK